MIEKDRESSYPMWLVEGSTMLLLFKYDILLILLACCFDVKAW